MSVVSVPENRIITGSDFNSFETFQDQSFDHSLLKREDLGLSLSNGFTIDNFLTKDECLYYIKTSQDKGYVNIDKEFPKEYRNNQRYIGKNQDLSKFLWERLENILRVSDLEGIRPYGFDQKGIWIPVGLDDCFTFGKYLPGGRFKPHYDATFADNPDRRSIYTLQIYLNDDYQGGKTNFFLPENPLEIAKHQLEKSVVPKTGRALIFNHDTLHEGAEVISGEKYIMRVDMMFLRIDKIDQDSSEKEKNELAEARKLFFKADSFEKDDRDLESAISTYVKAQMLLIQYPSVDPVLLEFEKLKVSSTTTSSTKPAAPRVSLTLMLLPEVPLFEIVKQMPLETLLKLKSTSKYFNSTLRKNILWKSLYPRHFSNEAYTLENGIKTNENEIFTPPFKSGTSSVAPKSPSFFDYKLDYGVKLFGKGKKEEKEKPTTPSNEKCWYLVFKSTYLYRKQSMFTIIDFGSEQVKYCNMDSSFTIIPNKASSHMQYSPHYVMNTMDREYWNVGERASEFGAVRPVQQGMIDFDEGKAIYEIIKSCTNRLGITSPLYLIVAPTDMRNQDLIRKLPLRNTPLLIKDFGALVLKSHGLTNGVVLNCGFGSTWVAAYGDGVLKMIEELPFNGEDCNAYRDGLMGKEGSRQKDEFALLRKKKTAFLYQRVSQNYKQETQYDTKMLAFLSPEMYFNPAIAEFDCPNIVETCVSFIESAQKRFPDTDFTDLILTGGFSTFSGFEERFANELKAKNPNILPLFSSDRLFDALKGARIEHLLNRSQREQEQQKKQEKKK
ncbi:hypothetical protein CYY_010267 [Polysphondylium violaceum]|uniref:Fe2OG dioxygenase domain-containing protein n=1 Tax=Polysphondylium violaceum TaxID=133409 RepID=A0A8J4PLM1_9MYCE|nr:hypothetical protein CYY_010267 [Polysphondylium violaceum]